MEGVTAEGLKVSGVEGVIAVDAIIAATGYQMTLPYIRAPEIMPDPGFILAAFPLESMESWCLSEDTSQMEWWHYFYPVHQAQPTFFGIGLMKVETAYAVVGELIARSSIAFMPSFCCSFDEDVIRAACGIASGRLKPPPKEEMLDRIAKEKAEIRRMLGTFPQYVSPTLSPASPQGRRGLGR